MFKDYKQDARNAAGIGAILLCIVNYLLIIFIGLIRSDGSGVSSFAEGYGGASAVQKYLPTNVQSYAGGYGGSLPEQKYQPSTNFAYKPTNAAPGSYQPQTF